MQVLLENNQQQQTNEVSSQFIFENIDNPELIIINAAKKGDNSILELFLDPVPETEFEINKLKEVNKYYDEIFILLRRNTIIKKQLDIFSRYQDKYTENLYEYLCPLQEEIRSELENLFQNFRLENRKKLVEDTKMVIDDHYIRLDTPLRVRLHNEFSLKLADEFKSFTLDIEFIVKNFLRRCLEELKKNRGILILLICYLLANNALSAEHSYFLADELNRIFQKEFLLEKIELGAHLEENSFIKTFKYYCLNTIENKVTQLENEIVALTKKASELWPLYDEAAKTIQEIERDRRRTYHQYKIKKYQLLSKLYFDHYGVTHKQEEKFFEKILNLQFDINYTEKHTHNNLIHIALERGQFKTALLLMKLGLNYKAKNKKSISAIDTQDVNGDTLLHYLTRLGYFDQVCFLIDKGGNPCIANKQNQTIFEIVCPQGSLIHYLLDNIDTQLNNQNYLSLLVNFFSQNMRLSSLLVEDRKGGTAFKRLMTLSDQKARDVILKKIKKCNRKKQFASEFESNINAILWSHFNYLCNEQVESWLKKLFAGTNDKSITRQLQFLEDLQHQLSLAALRKSDEFLHRYLNEKLTTQKMPTKLRLGYQTHVNYVTELKILSNRTNKSYFLAENENLIPHTSSYQKVTLLSQPINDQNIQDSSLVDDQSKIHPPLFKKPIAAKGMTVDLFHWFEPSTAHKP